jgi:hypothetical protein
MGKARKEVTVPLWSLLTRHGKNAYCCQVNSKKILEEAEEVPLQRHQPHIVCSLRTEEKKVHVPGGIQDL